MTTNLFVIDNVKQLRTGGSFRILLPFFRTSWCVGFLNSAIFNSFHNRVVFGTILEDILNFGGGGPLDVGHDFKLLGCQAASWTAWFLKVRPIGCFRNVGSQLPSYAL